jgi:hypothetical protein
LPVSRQPQPGGLAAKIGIDEAEAIDQAIGDGAFRDLVSSIPAPVIAAGLQAPAVVAGALAVFDQAGVLPEVGIERPGAVVESRRTASQQIISWNDVGRPLFATG